MIEKLLSVLFIFVKSVVASTGYGGIAILMAIESACIPLPSELIMPFAGYLVYAGTMKLLWVATAGAIGCNLGSLVAYEIGSYGGRPLVEKYGRWIFMGGSILSPLGLPRRVYRTIATRDPNLHRASGRHCAHAARPLSPVHVSWILAVVPGASLLWDEDGRKLAGNRQVFSSARSLDHRRPAGRRDLVCMVPLAEQNPRGGVAGFA
jgi:hypothetical protein